ncbi:MAG: hypothetical protein EXS37_14870 [Opitutus sp.]|nr:hypothetical protein [Opitutus sp.]
MKKSLLLIAGFAGALLSAAIGRAQTLTWTQRTTGVAAGLQYETGAYGGGKFVVLAYGFAAGSTSVFQTQAAVSSDGMTWTSNTLPTNPVGRGIGFGGGLFAVACERNGTDSGNTQNILTSPDGVTWTIRTTGVGSLSGVASSGTRWVAVGSQNGGQNAATSADGVTWTRVAVGNGSTNMLAIVANPTLNIFLASGSGNGLFLTNGSTGATTWSAVTLPGTTAGSTVQTISFVDGKFLVVVRDGFSSPTARLLASSDGTIWAQAGTITMPAGFIGNGSKSLTATSDPTGGNATVAYSGVFTGNTFAPQVLVSSGTLSTWTPNIFGSGDFVENRVVIYGNNLFVAANSGTQLFSAPVTGGGTAVPTVATHPATQAAALGGSVTFTAAGTGTGLSYQWLFNNLAIAGATSATYTIAAVAASNAGNYSVTISNAGGSITSNPATLTINAAGAGIAFLSNLSVRARAGSGSETLIVGITVGGGTVATSKSVLVRGVGPTLTTFGVTGVLADPVLTVLNGTTAIATNDDWGNDANVAAISAAIRAFPLPANSRDSALFGSGISSGGYTIQLTGKAGATGNALVELYDTAAAASVTANTTRFTNVSARTFGGTGADTLIVGFNIAGTGTRRLVIRAVGPGLAGFGVTGTMADPKLELYNGSTKVGENDNWDASTLAAQQSVGAFGLTNGSRDAVLVSTLPPGGYTVQVTGGTTGVTLVEVYEAP